jgi:transcriptional regulator with GAF, ATPase, and Fis domain
MEEGSANKTLRRRQLPVEVPTRQRLRVVHSPDAEAVGRVVAVDARGVVLGRGRGAPETFADARMSSRHARIGSTSPDELFIEDLGSGNGTFVSGRLSSGRTTLHPGDVLSLGETLIVVDTDADADDLPVAPHVRAGPIPGLIGGSLAADRLRRSLTTVARGGGAVLLLGPTGVGKEVAARAIHELSGRDGEWIAVNCAAVPSEIAEAELFGYRKGAFTGADADRPGHFVRASGGTLFLDEIGELSASIQAKLLRVLEDGTVQPLGGGPERKVDVRIVAATHVDLAGSSFRDDLLARLADWTLHLPPLADRRADVLELWRYWVGSVDASPRVMTAEFAEALLLHDWPMNIRELKKLAVRVARLSPPGVPLDLPSLPRDMQAPIRIRYEMEPAPIPTPRAPSTDGGDLGPGREALEAALQAARGNVKKAAIDNGWHRTQLYRWIKRAGIDPQRYR